jgi:hypothetical protein
VRLEGIDQLETFIDLNGKGTSGLTPCSILPRETALKVRSRPLRSRACAVKWHSDGRRGAKPIGVSEDTGHAFLMMTIVYK